MPTIKTGDFLLYLPTLLAGAKLTILLSLATICIAIVIALLVALGRLSRYRILRILLTGYVEFIRGTPGLVQIYYIFYVLPFWGLTLNAALAGVLGLSLNYGAYLSEVFRSGINSVPPTQREAAITIGLSHLQMLRFVILPQAFRNVLPPTVNYFLSLFKDTSLLSVITIQELTFSGLLLISTTFNSFVILTEIAIIYFAMCYPIALLATYLEYRLHRRRRPRGWWTAWRRMMPGLTRA
jgi:His/Glu/Gln/Arg/opine family amino acid ABC transporter permease subunit